MSARVDVLPDVVILSRRDRCRARDQLDGAGGRLVSHVIGHSGPHHRFHFGPDVSKIVAQKYLRVGQSRSVR